MLTYEILSVNRLEGKNVCVLLPVKFLSTVHFFKFKSLKNSSLCISRDSRILLSIKSELYHIGGWTKNPTYKLEHIFFIILSAVLAGANSINKIALFSEVKAKWIMNLILIEKTPSYGIFWWTLVRIKPDFMRELLGAWFVGLPDELRNQILAIDGKRLCGVSLNKRH